MLVYRCEFWQRVVKCFRYDAREEGFVLHAEITRNPKYQDRIYLHTFSIAEIILQFAISDKPQKVNPDHC